MNIREFYVQIKINDWDVSLVGDQLVVESEHCKLNIHTNIKSFERDSLQLKGQLTPLMDALM